MQHSLDPRWRHIMWQPEIGGRKLDVPVPFLANQGGPDIHLYAGFGEEHHATQAGVETLSRLGLGVAGIILPLSALEPTRCNIERACYEVPLVVAQTLNEQAGKPVSTPVNLIGKSQGGGVSLLAGSHAPERFGAIGVLAPVGLNREFLGADDARKRRACLRRLVLTNSLRADQNPLLDKGNWQALFEIGKRMLSDQVAGRLAPKLSFALEHSFGADIDKLKVDHAIRIFIGEGDPLFRVAEIAHTLGLVSCQDLLEVIPGSHSSLLSRPGAKQLEAVGTWMRDTIAA